MPIILAIETATEACSAALLIADGEHKRVISRFQLAPREHTKLILPMVEEVLAEANVELKDIDAIAFGRGPGAFTGLRIAAGIAQGLALSVDKPIIPVSTLSALALQVVEKEIANEIVDRASIIVALDARMGEVYWGEFRLKGGVISSISDEQVSKPQELFLKVSQLEAIQDKQLITIGSGWDVYKEEFLNKVAPENLIYIQNQYPTAAAIAKSAVPLFLKDLSLPSEEAQPVYIRNKVAEKPTKK
jgi:tRNA threonylcarbamoyladenosine biosynthesis protein TsaB